MIDDLVKRADDTADLLDAGSTTGVSTVLRQCASEIEHLQERIEALERQVKAADALAEAIRRTGYRVDHNGVTTLTGIDAMIPINDALAAYTAAKEGGA